MNGELADKIVCSEAELGLVTPEDVIQEAMLLIDNKFLATAGFLGYGAQEIKTIFGAQEWANHLEARLFARDYGDRPLTIDFIVALHRIHLQGSPQAEVPSIGDSEDPRAMGIINGKAGPFRCTPAQVEALNANPRVRWCPEPGDPLSGIIRYNVKSQKDRLDDLQGICDWYNSQPCPSNEVEVMVRSALTQHRLVSWHGLKVDYNGRTSRDVLNWSATKDGGSPSAPYDFDGDLFSTEDGWTVEVVWGALRYQWARLRIEKGITGADILPGVVERRALYEQHQTKCEAPPGFKTAGSWLDHQPFEAFVGGVVQLCDSVYLSE